MTRNRTLASALILATACAAGAAPASADTTATASSVPHLVFTNQAAFEATLDALAPGSRRNIDWDGVPIPGHRTAAIPPDFFLASRQIILDPSDPPAPLLVSNVGFGDLDDEYDENFPFFSPTINFKYVEDDGQPNVFRLADLKTPGEISAFGAVFTDVEKSHISGLKFLDSEGNELDTFYALPGPNGNQQFLGVIYARPVVAEVDVQMGEHGADFGHIDDVSNGGTADIVVVDDFVFQAATVPVPTIQSARISPTGSLKVSGLGFQLGAVILVDGQAHATKNNQLNPATRLSSREAGPLAQGHTVTIQVRNPDGTLSKPFEFLG